MFNGLIREIADVVSFENNELKLRSNLNPKLGDSIAINGACLTVTQILPNGFCVQISDETDLNIAKENYKNKVHVEPAMKLSDRIDGHLLQGHIDCIGQIKNIITYQNGTDFFIQLPKNMMNLVSNKGSIAVEGVSLTIDEVIDELNQIRLTIIPLTLKDTLFKEFEINRKLNIETDVLARYVKRILTCKKDISWDEIDLISSLY